MPKTCSECGFEYPEAICYRSNITGLLICASCLSEIRSKRETIIKHPKTEKPSSIRAKRIAKQKYEAKKRMNLL